MPFLKVIPEDEQGNTPLAEVKFIEVSAVFNPEEVEVTEIDEKIIIQEDSSEPEIIEFVQEIQEINESPENLPVEIESEPPQEQEPESEPVTVSEENEKIIDEIESLAESEAIAEIDEPEKVPDISEDIHSPEDNFDSDIIQEVPEEKAESESQESEREPEQESESGEIESPAPDDKYTGDNPQYDFTSGKRYVDLVSTKTDFDRMLDELASISHDIIEHEAERFAKKYTGKFQGDFDRAEADAKKFDAFLGGYITNAAMLLYDHGHREVAIQKLEETRKVLEARKKLEDETAAIKAQVEEEDAVVDLSDILGLFGDG